MAEQAAPHGPPAVVGAELLTTAIADLRTLVYRLADEVASFRRRALAAEARQLELESELAAALDAARRAEAERELAVSLQESTRVEAAAAVPAGETTAEAALTVADLERENAELRERLATAAERTRRLLERTRFLRQQQEETEEAS